LIGEKAAAAGKVLGNAAMRSARSTAFWQTWRFSNMKGIGGPPGTRAVFGAAEEEE
jgi:hypothetical protein